MYNHKEYMKKWDEKQEKNYWRNKLLKSKYNLTIEQYNELAKKQDNRCAICGLHQSELKKSLSVDHNHITGQNRELLCSNCNSMIGFSKESLVILRKAIEYLTKWHFRGKKTRKQQKEAQIAEPVEIGA